MDEDKLKVLKTEVTSILASSSFPLTVTQFLREYKEVIGRNFPWAQYGFKNPGDFLRSMPDVLCFRNNEIGEILVPVENNSAHITKLVQEQKKHPKKGFTHRRPRPVQLPRDNQKIELMPLKQLEVPNSLAFRGWERRQPMAPLPLMSVPTYNPSQNITYASSHKYSQFSQNLWNIDQSMVLNTYSTVQTEFTSTKLPLIPKKESNNELQCLNKKIVANGYSENENQSCFKSTTNRLDEKMASSEEDTSPYETKIENDCVAENTNIIEAGSKVDISEISSFDGFGGEEEDNCPIGEKMKENFRKILSKHKSGLLVSKLASLYFKMFNVTLNCQDYGFPTIKDLVMSCHDVFKIQQKKHAKDWLLFDVNNQSDDSTRWIPSQVLENMQDLSLAYPKGISSDDILKSYKRMFNVDLDISKLGFGSLTSFLVNCQSIECTTDGDKYVMFPMKWGKKYDDPEESTTDPFLSMDTFSFFSKKHFDEKVCGYQFCYKKCPLPKETTVKVLVADCISPDCLFLQTVDSAASLNALMYELNTFYDEEEQYYLMDEDVIHPGLACCVKFNNKQWHRGRIEDVLDNSETVQVVYVDYGTSSHVSFKDLRTLHKKFSEAAIHSFKSKIHNVKPVNNKSWSEECLEFLYHSILDDIFIAEIIEVKAEVASVILIDTKASDDRIINFMLIEGGFAVPNDSDTPENHSSNISEEETSCIIKNIEDIIHPYFLKLLPYWLHCARNWDDVKNILEQASHEFFNESRDDYITIMRNYSTSTKSVQNKILALFTKKPKVVCDAWSKTFYSIIDDLEKRFLENIEAELLHNYNQVENETSSNLKGKFDKSNKTSPNTFAPISTNYIERNNSCHNQNIDQYNSHNKSVTKNEDYYSYHDSSTDTASSMNINKESKDPKVIPANLFNTVIHLIRYNLEIYVLMDELLLKFAKGVPSMLVQHRLYQHQLNVTPFIVTSEHKLLYDELKRQRIGFKNGTVSLIPLSLSSDILLAVEPRNRSVAEVLKELANECYTSEEFWST